MGFFSDLFGGKESEVYSVSTLSASQQDIERRLGGFLKGRIGAGATPLTQPLVAEMPELFTQAYEALAGRMGEFGAERRAALMQDISGAPAWGGAGDWQREFKKEFAIPVMETWKETIAPWLREEFAAVPGGFYSAARGRGMEEAAGRFYGGYVQPKYWESWQGELGRQFASREAAAARRPAAVAQMTGLAAMEAEPYMMAAERMWQTLQRPIEARKAEELRLAPEADPYVRLGLQYMGIPTMETIAEQGTEGAGTGMLAGAGAGALMGSYGMLGTAGAGGGAALGALLAMSDSRVKHDVQPVKSAREVISKLKCFTYNIHDSSSRHCGLMAQDVEKVMPEAVVEINGIKHVDIYAIVSLLTAAVAELAIGGK